MTSHHNAISPYTFLMSDIHIYKTMVAFNLHGHLVTSFVCLPLNFNIHYQLFKVLNSADDIAD